MSVPGNGAVPGELIPGGIPALTNLSGRRFSQYPTKPPLVQLEFFSKLTSGEFENQAEPRLDFEFLSFSLPSLSRYFPLLSVSPGASFFPVSPQEFQVLPFPPPLCLQLPGLHPSSQGAFPSPCPTFPQSIPGFFPQGFICLLQYSLSPYLCPQLQKVFLQGVEQGREEWDTQECWLIPSHPR